MSAISPSAAYDLFADAYSRWLGEDFCRRAWPSIERLLVAHLEANASVLDLCCGSGQMARALSDRGFRVTGLDASDAMLRLARQNASRAQFFLGDARTFAFAQPFAAVLSTFNSMAHLSAASELEQVFRQVRAALVPGGVFLFDLSMEEAYSSKWRGTFGLVAEDHACIVSPSYDPEQRLGRNEVTLFRKSDPDQAAGTAEWLRTDLVIEQKCHSQDEVCAALQSAGFKNIDCYDGQRDLAMNGELGRMFFVGR